MCASSVKKNNEEIALLAKVPHFKGILNACSETLSPNCTMGLQWCERSVSFLCFFFCEVHFSPTFSNIDPSIFLPCSWGYRASLIIIHFIPFFSNLNYRTFSLAGWFILEGRVKLRERKRGDLSSFFSRSFNVPSSWNQLGSKYV